MKERQAMKAIGFYRSLPIENEESLIDLEIEKPTPTGRDLLVQVKAVSVNPTDVKSRVGLKQAEETPQILGRDVAGIVAEVGAECSLFRPGDEVYYAGSNVRPGGNSEFHLVDERIVGHKPQSLDFARAAALPLTSLTAMEGLFERLGIARDPAVNQGKTILIIGAAGGVGSVATQLADFVGLTVIGTASRQETVKWAKEHGAAHTINHTQAFVPQLKALGFPTVDYIFCLNDPERHWDSIVEAIVPQGKICSILPLGPSTKLDTLFYKSVTLVWELMYTRPMFQTPDMIEQHNLLEDLRQLVEAGKVKTTLTELLEPINAANMRKAHAKVESGKTIGKIVLANF
ncbi:zinc-binding alcohol dehydrogenase family protein [Ktedonosporobacter rubrisoli]|uniref:Zinc-type alcohol dehydrogenase-like protein n=1 Tax=Ktedonosporobacter rubrisoli TaxID=2509675 RepID=A0A4P6JLY5_KTERU|nr:zinc-binding alcohol dehydrogenase family protein [Ktedonosporobacter rubrisoli]QBD76259.1 zinc-binding alcohol dehydrogenase family protein [Ktedonosporobacter rubrisoli]